ncbi:MAG: alpha-galactosidase [FCB group bacterium]|jgi:alpha-galactosidase|nr:alpha-galactosidase [FCB group bacterium]
MFTAILLALVAGAGDTQALDAWVSSSSGEQPVLPFSFTYGDAKSADALKAWPLERKADNNLTSLTWRDPATGLEVRCEIMRFSDSPAVEWILYFKNTGTADTLILDSIQALDTGLPLARDKAARVHYAKGSECRLDDFGPLSTPLGPDATAQQAPWIGEGNPLRLASREGRSSCGVMPFFNVDMGARGVIGAVGWTGDWAADLFRTDDHVRMRAGMQRTHLKLLPGEEIRSPRMMLLFWEGDRVQGQNQLRRFILAHHTPRVDGVPQQVPIANATWGGNFAKNHIAHAKFWQSEGLPMEYLWVDAGWFGKDEAKEGANVFNSQWGSFVGDWYANPGYFPNGLIEVSDALKAMNMKFLLWLEPERVFKDTTWTREHPEWLQGPVGPNHLYDLGNPEARKGLADFLSKLIEEGGIGCYRQDFNMDPRPFWDAADAPDRVGMSEIGHITGLYALWDELLARHPGLLIDNCSSGGRRIDLETISRSMPLWRSDTQCWPNFSAVALQTQTQGLGAWVPLSAACCDREDTYTFRSALGPGIVMAMYDFEKDVNLHFSTPWLRDRLAELVKVRDYFLGDFYPLLSYSTDEDAWAAWQYDKPEHGDGMVLALRRPQSPFTSMTPKLRGLDPNAEYEFTDVDTGAAERFSGKALIESGIKLAIVEQPGSKLLTYRKVQ